MKRHLITISTLVFLSSLVVFGALFHGMYPSRFIRNFISQFRETHSGVNVVS
jgi:hypothetical protein